MSRGILEITQPSGAQPFDLTGGALCLDFVNTLGNRRGPEPLEERLAAFGDLVEFGLQAGIVSVSRAAALRETAAARPEAAARVLARARELREALYRIFEPLARGAAPAGDGLPGLNAELGRALGHARVESRDDGYALGWEAPGPEPPDLDAPLWPVAHSAMEVLLEADLSRLGECDSDTCGFLYLDTSRNKSRRWCDTRVCGNRARVRAHRRRAARA